MKIKRALISVYDKKGILPFAKALHAMGVRLVSTGGTAKLLKGARIPVTEVSEVTRFPEMLDGRVKTLHPRLYAGILALRDNPGHMRTLKKHKIEPIDLVVVNLYPFWDAVRGKKDEHAIIEMIDIGGLSMLRAAAKNFRFVGVISDPKDYGTVLKEMKKNGGVLSQMLSRKLAGKAFHQTARYDGLIARYFQGGSVDIDALPAELELDFEKVQDLRYGENSHQKGALYREVGIPTQGLAKAKKLHGKELSFNNILDLDAACEMVSAFDETVCAIVKHTNPCGLAIGRTAEEAFRKAYASDPVSAFGGIVGFNAGVDAKTAQTILNSGFLECVVARGFTKEALLLLKQKKNLRLLTLPDFRENRELDFKKVRGGLLLQDRDSKEPARASLKSVTRKAPSGPQIQDLLFAFKVSRFVKSNAIVVAKGCATIGIGGGQASRVDSCEVALKKAGARARGAVLASDGFFPKPDSIALARRYGINAVIQPGGSIQDEAVVAAANRAGIAMVLTGLRHFKH